MRIGMTLAVLLACAHAAPNANQDLRLAAIKAGTMSADYRADVPALDKYRQEAAALFDDASAGYLAHYWAGFANWRAALNGAFLKMDREEMKDRLDRALADFRASIRQKGDFADSYAAAASISGWRAAWEKEDAPAFLAESRQLLARARELAPDNPRVLWVVGGIYLFAPPSFGGNKALAIETYRRMAKMTGAESSSGSPLPDWGRPEAFMSLAFSHLQLSPPDLAAAADEAHQALQLQPDWVYVRDQLLPQIAGKAHP